MQRSSYAPPPAHSPPLHHPVPQHVSTVPMMRSPLLPNHKEGPIMVVPMVGKWPTARYRVDPVSCAGFWGFHERSHGADGVSIGEKRRNCRAGIYGAERMHQHLL